MKSLPDINSLSLQELVAQMVTIRASGYLYDHQIQYPQWESPNRSLLALLGEYGVGGVTLVGGSAPEIYLRSQQLQAWAKFPLLIAADIEEGVGQRFKGATWFPPPMALQAVLPDYAEAMGKITAIEAAAIGINWLFAPVADVNNNPANPVINVRAFGETTGEVMGATRAFILGTKPYPVLTTVKHFPGHGDTAVDSHLHTPVIPHDRDRFNQVELPPFAHAIAAGVDAVMTAHISAPALDADNLATLSPHILTDILRHELKFEGLVVTDALIMAGVADRYTPEQVAVQAVKAGADILLMPIDPILTIDTVCKAVESGEIPRDRILASVERIWKAKARVCQAPTGLASVAQSEHLATAEAIATHSIRFHVPNPIVIENDSPKDELVNLILVDDPLACEEFLHPRSPAIVLPHQYGCQRLVLDGQALSHLHIEKLPNVLLQIFSRGNPFRGSAEMHGQTQSLIQTLVSKQKLKSIAVYGSPYNLDRLLPLLPVNLSWAFAYSQQPAAQSAILQKLGLTKKN
ncbi:glycoside hydrolase family 3 N-terminal domain-containing protein [Tumidithrix helvetica PCC 7403]|uniref:glycoside hydrolase family 3 N-terminal domain-containing protein n=1 Tax=Tumidithrix helvetica TaxID=3457545 RepID=UPI003C9D9342